MVRLSVWGVTRNICNAAYRRATPHPWLAVDGRRSAKYELVTSKSYYEDGSCARAVLWTPAPAAWRNTKSRDECVSGRARQNSGPGGWPDFGRLPWKSLNYDSTICSLRHRPCSTHLWPKSRTMAASASDVEMSNQACTASTLAWCCTSS